MKKLWAMALALLVVSCAHTGKTKTAQPCGAAPKRHVSLSTNPQLTNDAISYYVSVVKPLVEIKQAQYEYVKNMVKFRRVQTIEKSRQLLLKKIQSYFELIGLAPAFQGDSTFKLELIQYFNVSYSVLKGDFDKILNMEQINAQTTDQEEAHELAIDKAIEKQNESFSALKKVEGGFFKKYQIDAADENDELTLKIERANKAIAYYDTISKVFNKANRQKIYATQDYNNKDLVSLEQHTSILLAYAQDGMQKLARKQGFEGDDGLLTIAKKAMEFYKKEGETVIPVMVEFFMKSDNIDKTKKKFDAIKQEDRKKEDIDEFNKEVDLFNKAIKEINSLNSESDKTHKKIVDEWNNEMRKFFEKHS